MQYLLPLLAFAAFAMLPRAWWSVGVSFVACSLGILFSSAISAQVLESATVAPFLLANGAFAAGVFHLVRRSMAPTALARQIALATLVVFAGFGLTFWGVLTLIGS